MVAVLRLCEDTLASDARPVQLPPLPRMVFVVHGTLMIDGCGYGDGETWHGEDAVALSCGPEGATCWRFEFATSDLDSDGAAAGPIEGPGVASRLKLAAALHTLPPGELLLRGDSVAFPPGGCAYRHRHQGPGIRCVFEGGIRIDTHGRSTSYGPGGAWYETGPDPVFAQAAADRQTRFIRVMLLPRELLGKSSIEYLDDADKARPKSQMYQVFVDAPIARPGRSSP